MNLRRGSCRYSSLVVLAAGLALAGPAQAASDVNGSIVYTTDGTNEMYTVDPEGLNNTRITHSKVVESEPQYSPDGARIALVEFPPLKQDELYVMNADGSGETQLTHAQSPIDSPRWSADGLRILFLTERDDDFDGAEIHSINPDGSDDTVLATNSLSLSSGPALSTAGGKIAYTRSDGEIVVMNIDGSSPTTPAAGPDDDRNPVLSPDAGTVAFDSDRAGGGDFDVYTMTIAGADFTRFTTGGASVAGFSPDGQRIAFTDGRSKYSRAAAMNADGTNAVLLSPPKRNNSPDQFSPDSSLLAFSETLPLPGEDPFYRLFDSPIDASDPLSLTEKDDGAVYGDWQGLSAPPPIPSLTLKAKTVTAQAGKPPKARITCSNECDVAVAADGEVEGEDVRSRTKAHLYGRDTGIVPLLGAKTLKQVAGERGRVTAKVRVKDGFGHKASATLKVKIAG